MAFFDSLLKAVQSYFSPKPAVQNTVPNIQRSSPVITPGPAARSTLKPVAGPAARSTPSSPAITQSRPSSGGGGGSSGGGSLSGGASSGGGLPSSQPSAPQGDFLDKAASKIVQFKNAPVSTVVGDIGKVGQGLVRGANIAGNPITAGTTYTPKVGMYSLFQGLQDIAGNPNLSIQDVIEYLKKGAGPVSGQTLWQSIPTRQMLDATSANRYPWNIAGTGISTSNLPSNQRGAVPSSMQRGAPQAQQGGLVPSPVTGARGGVVPSAVNAGTLPANMAGLNQGNVNPALAQSMTPEAIQSIGQLLLRSLLGNQSSLTSLSPGIAQALWGAPTASSAFGGYEGGAAVPNQMNIEQPKNLPPTPQPLNMG